MFGRNWGSSLLYSSSASSRAVRIWGRSVASEMTSKTSWSSMTSSAPASSTAIMTSSSVTPSALATSATPLRSNMKVTEPGSAIVPPLRVTATRTSEAARFLLSVRHSMYRAEPSGPRAS